MIFGLITLIGALGMFLFGMNMMSTGLQKTAGAGLRRFMASVTSNPVKGVATGFGMTAVIQSSSATTVMVVGFVNAGLLTLKQAIGVIMGANIGTTMTAWIVALFGFKFDMATMAIPLMALGFLLSISKKSKWRNASGAIVGFCLLFLGLSYMKGSVPDLRQTPEILSFIQNWTGHGIWSVLLFVLIGSVLTLILQSSSATVALTLIFVDMEWIGFDMAAAMVLGENIGTTITANIAAAMGNTASRRAALAHTVFNMFGVTWAILLFRPFLALISSIVGAMGLSGGPESALYSVATLHTVFNLINTGLLIWFIPQIEKIVCATIHEKESDEPAGKLKYLNAGMISTPELAIPEADKELLHFGQIMQKGLSYVESSIATADDADKFEPFREKLVSYEEISDRIEFEIVSFLNKIDRSALSETSTAHIRSMYRIASELESLGDSGEAISRLIVRSREHGQRLSEDHKYALQKMTRLLYRAYDAMVWNIEFRGMINNIDNAVEAEKEINEARNAFREAELKRIDENGSTYFESYFFLEFLDNLEQMGDYIINVSQAL